MDNQTLKHLFAFVLVLFALFLLVSSSSRPASCNEILPKMNADPSNYQPAAAYQALRIKNTKAIFLDNPEFDKKRKRKMKRRKINAMANNYFKKRPSSVMLPKGYVPPSGPSPCHNDKPDSSSVAHALICGLSSTIGKP